ncbi:MAG: hypothetical protein Q8R67_04140 [Rhodoferax sp.]|nr:hypothetical protein [Rhodoferax sp.]MDP3650855.1 hypothetical protein [Rhodoferax sp.]
MKYHPRITAGLVLVMTPLLASAQIDFDGPLSPGSAPSVVTDRSMADCSSLGSNQKDCSHLNGLKLTNVPHFGRLTSQQLQGIQLAGTAILGAKATRPNDSAVEALKSELRALAVELDQATNVPVSVSPGIQRNLPDAAEPTKVQGSSKDSVGVLRARLANIDIKRKQKHDEVHQKVTPEQRALAAVFSKKVDELTQEISSAIAGSNGERLGRLIALRDRMQIKTVRELMFQRRGGSTEPLNDETPTLSILPRQR